MTVFINLKDNGSCLCRSWCPDRTISQARKYVREAMGPEYTENVILDLEKTQEEANNRTPLICFLSMGSDPTNNIEALAKKLKIGECSSWFWPGSHW